MRPNNTERGQTRRGQSAALALPVYRCGHEPIECIATQSLPGMAAYSRFDRATDPVYSVRTEARGTTALDRPHVYRGPAVGGEQRRAR